MTSNNDSPFLKLPTELRLLIYASALSESSAITVGSAKLVGRHADIVHRLYANDKFPFSGIPEYHEPVITSGYDSSLLSITHPAVRHVSSAESDLPDPPPSVYTTQSSLQQTCRQTREELERHFTNKAGSKRNNFGIKLFASFPSGLHILRTLAPGLIKQANSIHLAGTYTPTTFNTSRAARVPTETQTPAKPSTSTPTSPPPTTDHLTTLLLSLFGPHPTHPIAQLDLRIYYPGSDSYSTVWGDDDSPIVVALKNIYAGEVDIEVWRGQKGTGVHMRVREGQGRKRVVSTVWKKLEEGRRPRDPEVGSWVVDGKWPDVDLDTEGEGGTGEKAREGEMVVTIGAGDDREA